MALRDFCKDLPKVELHAHLNGSVPLATLERLAREQGVDGDSRRFFLGERGTRSLAECFKLFEWVYQLTQTDESIYHVTKDVIASFASDNVIYLELRTTPKDNAITGRTKQSYIDAVIRAIDECNADASLSITTRLILSIDRTSSL